jgi:hypothetical protein
VTPVLFRVPVYGGVVRLHTTPETFEEHRRALLGDVAPLRATASRVSMFSTAQDGRLYLVGWFDGKVSSLSHELVHVADMVLRNAGIDPRSNDAEPLAYLQGELMMLCGY